MPRILVVRFSSIGDIVLTSPVIRCLKLQLNAEIHFLTKENYAGILSHNPYLSKVFSIKKKVEEVTAQLQAEKYDYVVDLHKNLRSFKVRLALKAKYLTFDKTNLEKWLLVNFKIDKMPALHITQRYLAALKPLGVRNDHRGLDYFIPPATTLPEVMPAEPFVVFAIGAAHATKRLPFDKILSICDKLNYPVLLLGGSGEKETGERIVQSCRKDIINLCGKISLHQSALITRESALVITHDTGMMHIAAALKKPTISIWGSTVPAFGMTPCLPDDRILNKTVEVEHLSCRPCSKIGHKECPKGHFKCMKDIDETNITETVTEFFSLLN